MSGPTSMQASVTFNDVAICFSEEDWMCLEEWQKEMYRNVMHEIHGALTAMGYTISNPDVLVRILNPEVNIPGKGQGTTKEKSSCKFSSGFLSRNPDIFLRVIKHDDDDLLEDSVQPHKETGSSSGDEGNLQLDNGSTICKDEDLSDDPCSYPEIVSVSEEWDNVQLDNGSTICKDEDLSDDPCPYQEIVSVSEESKDQTSKKRIAKHLRKDKAKNNFQRDRSSDKMAPRTSVMERTNQSVRVIGLTRKRPSAESKSNTKERLYICTFCGKSFGGNSLLVRHMRIHTGEKPYACNHCDKSFNDKSYLLRHVRTHTGEKPYSCSVCFKSFSQSSSVVAHMRIHTGERPFKCTECERRFSDKSYYLRHLRSHRGERPYKCKECDKCFTQTSSLACHMKLHTGAKPFRCSYCGEYFSNNSRLAVHKRLHQQEETQ